MLYVRLTIKVKVRIPESFKVGWYPPKITGSTPLNAGPHVCLLLHTPIVLGRCYELLFLLILFCLLILCDFKIAVCISSHCPKLEGTNVKAW